MKILIISSIQPYKSANLGNDMLLSLRDAGHEVDFLTKYNFSGADEQTISVFDKTEDSVKNRSNSFIIRFKIYLLKKMPFIFKRDHSRQIVPNPIEEKPDVNCDLISERIQNEYDLVIITFWQYMITSVTVKAVYDKLKCPIFLIPVDMFPMTGGCYYFLDCKNYKNECFDCPVKDKFDFFERPHKNYLLKQKIYNSIDCYFLMNKWMKSRYEESKIIKTSKIFETSIVINEKTFFVMNKNVARERMSLPQDKTILFAGAANFNVYRKGFDHLIEAMRIVCNMVDNNNLLLVLAGNGKTDYSSSFECDVKDVGYLSIENLSTMYSAADLFISSSFDDAGPTMVNQSLMCGTPVVAFDTGVAQELVINDETGYRAKLKDTNDLALGIIQMIEKNEYEKKEIRDNCRNSAMEKYSLSVWAKKIEEIYNQVVDNTLV